jgi:hypothetical protein
MCDGSREHDEPFWSLIVVKFTDTEETSSLSNGCKSRSRGSSHKIGGYKGEAAVTAIRALKYVC